METARRRRVPAWLRTALGNRWLPLWLALVAFLLTLPALGIGWQMDDHFHRLLLLGKGPPEISAWRMFSGPPADPELLQKWVDLGAYPWWVSDGFRFSFFRIVSVATARIDFWLWPGSAALMHLQSLVWFAALIAAVAVLYRRLLTAGSRWPAWTAGLAALLFAVDDAHAPPASWLANRNALLATLFGVLCLIAHDRWRREGDRRAGLLAPLWLALGLASGEMATATAGYLLAYALFREPSGRRRVRSLLPCGGVLAAWAVWYVGGGFGASGSGLYVDPVARPLDFLVALGERAPLLLLGQWSPVPADLGTLLPPERTAVLWWLALAAIALLATALLPLLRADRGARFWLTGMLLALLPISATMPSNRLLFFVGLGAMPLLACFLAGVWSRAEWLPGARAWRRFAAALATLLAIVHLPLAALGMPLGPWTIASLGSRVEAANRTLPVDPRLAEQELVLVNAPDYLLFVTHVPTMQALAGRPVPKRVRALATGPTPVEILRLDERTLRVRLERGLFAGPLGRLFRPRQEPFAAGDRVEVAGLAVEIVAVDGAGVPVEVDYRFATPLEDPARRWLRWDGGGHAPFTPPAVGERTFLEPAIGPFDLFYPR